MPPAFKYPAPAVLAVWMDIVPELKPTFDEWYYREHIPERVAVPGFWRGRRYCAVDGAPAYFACYDIADIGVPTSSAYLARLNNPTNTTCRIMPGFRNMIRAICSVVAHSGGGSGGALAAILIEPVRSDDALHDWIVGTAFAGLLARPGIVSSQLWAADNTETPHTRERELRIAKDQTIEMALIVEGTDVESVGAATTDLISDAGPLSRLCRSRPRRILYRHQFTLDAGCATASTSGAASGAPSRDQKC